MSKHIEIDGIHNKYMMNKFILKNNKKKENDKIFFDNCYNYDLQKQLINKLYLNEVCENCNILSKELQKKLNGYLNQDKKKNRYNKDFFISLEQVIEKIVSSQMKCFYCKDNILLLYKNIRDPFQWTLERIDNNIQHQLNNIEICCLKCNIQRKNQNSDAFKFSKQFKIIKKE